MIVPSTVMLWPAITTISESQSPAETIELLKQKGMGENPDVVKRTVENVFLTTLLPKTMSVEEIKAVLADVADAIKAGGGA